MLLQVTIENFLSFREATTFSLLANNRDEHHANHLAADAAGKGRSVLPISAIYGANAAGKSNLIEVLSFVQDLIVEGTRSSQPIPVAPFKLSRDRDLPSTFDFKFIYRENLYSYGFKLNRKQIFSEWLDVKKIGQNKKDRLMFERVTSEQQKTKVEFGRALRGRSQKQEQFLEFIAQGTRPNQLFLTEAVERNVEEVKPIWDWFRQVLVIIPAESTFRGLEIGVLSSQEFTEFLSSFLKFADTGIAGIVPEEVNLDFDLHFPGMPEEIREDIFQSLLEADEGSAIVMEVDFNQYLLTLGERDRLKLIQLKTQHHDWSGELVSFSLAEESEGTQRLINLLPALFMLQKNPERVFFLDELDRRLHPLLSRQFIQLALDCRNTNSQNQFIFTTHDTNLLDLDILRKDEIWFVEKNQQGESVLYSLDEFKLDESIQVKKGYLNGRFGAIPFFGDIRNLKWLDCSSESSTRNNGKKNKNQANQVNRSQV